MKKFKQTSGFLALILFFVFAALELSKNKYSSIALTLSAGFIAVYWISDLMQWKLK